MELNEIKKELYKQKPQAVLTFIRKQIAYYLTVIKIDNIEHTINFEIPINDMGDADLYGSMDAKLLIRWITSQKVNNMYEN